MATSPKTPAPLEITGWKKEIKGKKIFDWQTILEIIRSKQDKNTIVKDLVPNKEMFEWWLLDVGSKSPSDFRKGEATERGTTDTLYAQILFFTGQAWVDTKHPSFNERHVYEWFRDLQHLIQNNEMFWLLFVKFYVDSENSLNAVELNKPERNKVPLVSRIRAFYKLYAGSNETEGLSLQHHLDFLDQYDDDDEISVFRTFSVQTKKYDDDGKLVHKGRAVRKGITRLSDESGIHITPQDICSFPEKGFNLSEGQFGGHLSLFRISSHNYYQSKISRTELNKVFYLWIIFHSFYDANEITNPV